MSVYKTTKDKDKYFSRENLPNKALSLRATGGRGGYPPASPQNVVRKAVEEALLFKPEEGRVKEAYPYREGVPSSFCAYSSLGALSSYAPSSSMQLRSVDAHDIATLETERL